MYIPESPVGSEILGPKNHQNQTVLGLKFDTQTGGSRYTLEVNHILKMVFFLEDDFHPY